MHLISLLAQTAPEGGADNTTLIRIIAGALAVVCIVVILIRRKRKASKENWS